MATLSRPPTLLTLAHRQIVDAKLFRPQELVLCACSGGPDSNALLHVLALLRRRLDHRLLAIGVDHGLRSKASLELDLVAALADELEVPFERIVLAVEPGSNLQARARDARHEALADAARRSGALVIATGHTADDRAETLMLRLLRGAGPRGLAVLPPQALGQHGLPLIRPLLRARRSDVMAHLKRHDLAYAEDPSNCDPRFLRTEVRQRLMPLLEELSPQVVKHFGALADMLASEADAELDDLKPQLSQLNRAQRLAVERAVRSRRGGSSIRIEGGRELELRFVAGKPTLRPKQ